MNIIIFIAFQFFRYFKNRGSAIPYFSTLVAITLFLYLHFLLLLVLFDQFADLNLVSRDSKEEKWTKVLLVVFPFYLFCYYLVRKRRLEGLTGLYTDPELRMANTRLLIYTLLLFLVMFVFAIA